MQISTLACLSRQYFDILSEIVFLILLSLIYDPEFCNAAASFLHPFIRVNDRCKVKEFGIISHFINYFSIATSN